MAWDVVDFLETTLQEISASSHTSLTSTEFPGQCIQGSLLSPMAWYLSGRGISGDSFLPAATMLKENYIACWEEGHTVIKADAGVIRGDEELRGVLGHELHPRDLAPPRRIAAPVLHVCSTPQPLICQPSTLIPGVIKGMPHCPVRGSFPRFFHSSTAASARQSWLHQVGPCTLRPSQRLG